MNESVMKATGTDGTIELRRDRIIIARDGILAKIAGNTKRELPYASVAEILFKDAGSLGFGYIDFARHGTVSEKDKTAFKVKFKKDQQAEFARLKEKTYEILNYYARQK